MTWAMVIYMYCATAYPNRTAFASNHRQTCVMFMETCSNANAASKCIPRWEKEKASVR